MLISLKYLPISLELVLAGKVSDITLHSSLRWPLSVLSTSATHFACAVEADIAGSTTSSSVRAPVIVRGGYIPIFECTYLETLFIIASHISEHCPGIQSFILYCVDTLVPVLNCYEYRGDTMIIIQ